MPQPPLSGATTSVEGQAERERENSREGQGRGAEVSEGEGGTGQQQPQEGWLSGTHVVGYVPKPGIPGYTQFGYGDAYSLIRIPIPKLGIPGYTRFGYVPTTCILSVTLQSAKEHGTHLPSSSASRHSASRSPPPATAAVVDC